MSSCLSAGAPANESHILVVDDESSVRDLLNRWLSDAGYKCDCASSAAAAWDFLEGHEVDLVTTDIRMPGESGIDLLGRVVERFPDAAVLMLTGCEDTRLAIQALTQGAWGYLLKPAQREELLSQVARSLKRRRLAIEQRHYARELETRVRDQTLALRSSQEETIHRLITASMVRDDETGSHIKRIGLFSAAVAEAMRWSADGVDLIRFAAPMHDIGKVGIPDAILRKPARLTEEETIIMKTHTLIGAKMLSGSASPMLQMAERIARWHHERWDGTGYPDGLCGPAIPKVARIVAVVDVYDALTHDRVYRPALLEDDVLALLDRGSGTQFDPDVVAAFFASLDAIRTLAAQETEPPAAANDEEATAAHEIGAHSLV